MHKFKLEPGMHHGQQIMLEGQGNQMPHTLPGDVIIRLRQKVTPKDRFSRNGHDLTTTLSITLLEALTGFSKTITHLDGHSVGVTMSKVVQPEFVLKIPGEGMPIAGTSNSGDMLVHFQIQYPKDLHESEKEGMFLTLSRVAVTVIFVRVVVKHLLPIH